MRRHALVAGAVVLLHRRRRVDRQVAVRVDRDEDRAHRRVEGVVGKALAQRVADEPLVDVVEHHEVGLEPLERRRLQRVGRRARRHRRRHPVLQLHVEAAARRGAEALRRRKAHLLVGHPDPVAGVGDLVARRQLGRAVVRHLARRPVVVVRRAVDRPLLRPSAAQRFPRRSAAAALARATPPPPTPELARAIRAPIDGRFAIGGGAAGAAPCGRRLGGRGLGPARRPAGTGGGAAESAHRRRGRRRRRRLRREQLEQHRHRRQRHPLRHRLVPQVGALVDLLAREELLELVRAARGRSARRTCRGSST